MAKYPYILKTGSLKKLLENIPSVGIPDKVTIRYLYAIGFKSRNDRALIPVLKSLKCVDDSGTPTNKYRQFRDKNQSKKILGATIKAAYSEIFKIYPDAAKKDGSTLQNFFSTNTGLGERAVKSIVETFKALCSIADFNADGIEDEGIESSEIEDTETPQRKSSLHTIDLSLGEGRKARIMVPEDIKAEEIDKLKKLLDVLK